MGRRDNSHELNNSVNQAMMRQVGDLDRDAYSRETE